MEERDAIASRFSIIAMTKREIAFLCCRLLALYLLMNSIFLLGQSLTSLGFFGSIAFLPSGSSSSLGINALNLNINYNGARATNWELVPIIAFTLLPTVLTWVAALGLWIGARGIALRLFDDMTEEAEAGPAFVVGTEARAVAFACMGLFFLAQDAPRILFWLVSVLYSWVLWSKPNTFVGYDHFSWEWLIRIPISLWLLFGLRGLAGLWRMAQEKGIAPRR